MIVHCFSCFIIACRSHFRHACSPCNKSAGTKYTTLPQSGVEKLNSGECIPRRSCTFTPFFRQARLSHPLTNASPGRCYFHPNQFFMPHVPSISGSRSRGICSCYICIFFVHCTAAPELLFLRVNSELMRTESHLRRHSRAGKVGLWSA